MQLWPVGGAGAEERCYVHTHCGQFLNILIRRSQGSQTDLLRELSKLWICQQRNVTQQLVTRVTESKHQHNQKCLHRVTLSYKENLILFFNIRNP